MRFIAALLVILSLASVGANHRKAWAADADQKTSVDPASAKFAFNQKFDEWKKVLVELHAIKAELQITPPPNPNKLPPRAKELMHKSEQLLPEVIAAAETAYVATNGKNKQLEEFLVAIAIDRVDRDRYEEVQRLVNVLLEQSATDPRLHLLSGICALMLGEFDLADEQLEIARQAELLKNPEPDDRSMSARIRSKALRYLADPKSYRATWAEEQAIRAAEAAADDLPRVQLQTTKGDVVVELFENEAPNTVANFIHLVEQGFYDGLKFHRVLPGFVAQTGCPNGDGTGGPGYKIPCECYRDDARKHLRGSLSMALDARIGRDTGGSQFFISLVPTPALDGKHTVFGRVIEGMDAVTQLTPIDPELPQAGREPDAIVKATVLRKRDHPYVPETIEAAK